jgi:hypothetical protein
VDDRLRGLRTRALHAGGRPYVSLRRPGIDTVFGPVGRPEALAAVIRPVTTAFPRVGAVRGLVFGAPAGNLSQVA